MFDIPGFDPQSMSDDELITRQSELNRRFSYASRFSASTELASQLLNLIGAIEAERRDRILRQSFEMRQQMFPDIIESEPDLVKKEKPVVEDDLDDEMITRRKQGKQKFALSITRSATPEGSTAMLPPKTKGSI